MLSSPLADAPAPAHPSVRGWWRDRPRAQHIQAPQWSACATSWSRSRRCWSSSPSPSLRTRARRRARPADRPTPSIPPPADTPVPTATETPVEPGVPPDFAEVDWRDSKALGRPVRQGPAQGRRPAARARRGLLHLGPGLQPDPQPRVASLGHRPPDPHRSSRCIHEYRTERDSAQRVGIMDLSRPHGGRFGRNFGGLGHATHQNGLDADILYPRKDGTETRAMKP